MAVRIGSNISSLQAQRRLSESSSTLSKSYERLSSGQRINRASDDAAGLSIADSLGVGRRVFVQGVRNLNDGISALQIADSTVSNLSQVVTRIRELAEQAGNGAYSSTQRNAMDKEAKELQKEYFRISRSCEFNGTNLFDGSLADGLRLQGGFGVEGSIQSSLGGVMGNGTFAAKTSFTTGSQPYSAALGDLNGDGVLDMVTADYGSDTASILLGNGDGTFSRSNSYTTGVQPASVTLGDLNGDGLLDMVTADAGADKVSVFLGKGDGTFSAKTSYTTGADPYCVKLGDLNGDGVLDMATADVEGTASIFLGRGDGIFSARISLYLGGGATMSLDLGDLNGDGMLDLAVADNDTGANVLLGRGDGTFSSAVSIATGLGPRSVNLGDLNGDAVLDMVTADMTDDTVSVFIGSGDGTFSARTAYTTDDEPGSIALGDLNGDGVVDIIAGDTGSGASVLLGKGDGTFLAKTSCNVGYSRSITLGDLNGDGVLDLVSVGDGGNSARVVLGNTREGIAPLLPFSLTTQADALQAMAPLDRKLSQLAAQRGVIGAFQSRLSVAINTMQSTSENYGAAESRIRDTDVASDTAELMRLQISQQAATAVLAQANQAPGLAIQLLRGD